MGEPGKIFVGNLPFRTDDRDLRDEFQEYGEIDEAVVIQDRETGKSRGFGFVTFHKPDDADDCIEKTREKEMDGRQLKINIANPPRSRDGGGGRGGRSYGDRSYGDRSYNNRGSGDRSSGDRSGGDRSRDRDDRYSQNRDDRYSQRSSGRDRR